MWQWFWHWVLHPRVSADVAVVVDALLIFLGLPVLSDRTNGRDRHGSFDTVGLTIFVVEGFKALFIMVFQGNETSVMEEAIDDIAFETRGWTAIVHEERFPMPLGESMEKLDALNLVKVAPSGRRLCCNSTFQLGKHWPPTFGAGEL